MRKRKHKHMVNDTNISKRKKEIDVIDNKKCDYRRVTKIKEVKEYLADNKTVAFDFEIAPDEEFRNEEQATLCSPRTTWRSSHRTAGRCRTPAHSPWHCLEYRFQGTTNVVFLREDGSLST